MIRLAHLTIQAFRGVPDVIEIDLSAPLTLIYAPNGSGKTTICDAIEWLFTGTVKRLEQKASPENIRCQFSKADTPTLVVGELEVSGERILLKRSEEECFWQRGTGKLKKVKSAELLELLAPSAVEPTAHRSHANSSRQIWLRGTRFLSGEALATLLDSDSDSRSTRERVFADVLGVGHLLETERQMEGYQKEISQAIKQQQALVNEKLTVIADRAQHLPSTDAARREQSLEEADRCVAKAFASLDHNYAATTPVTSEQVVKSATTIKAELDTRRSSWNARRQSELAVTADWPQRLDLEKSIVDDTAALASLNAAEEEAAEAVIALDTEMAPVISSALNLQTEIDSLSTQVSELHQATQRALPQISAYLKLTDEKQVSLEFIENLLVEFSNAGVRNKRIALLNDLLRKAPAYQAALQQRPSLVEASENANSIAPQPEEVSETRAQLKLAEQSVASIKSVYEQASGPIQQLRHLAIAASNHLEHDQHCPVCNHDWKSSSSLKSAIAAAAKDSPNTLNILNAQLLEAQRIAEAHSSRLSSFVQKLAHKIAAATALNEVNLSIATFEDELKSYGLADGLNNPTRTIELAVARIRLYDTLLGFRNSLLASSKLTGGTLLQSAPALSLAKTAHAAIHSLIGTKEKEVRSLQEVREGLSGRLAKAREHHASTVLDRTTAERRLAANQARISALLAAWQTFAGQVPWTDEALSKTSSGMRAEFDTIELVDRLLNQATALIRELSQFEELDRIRAELEPIAAERDRLLKLAESAASILTAYQEHRKNNAKRQMSDLVRTIAALFVRMQANLVYDNISLGDDSASFDWTAIAEDKHLNPDHIFSQGQRQDFALSIFIARARGLGGSFILDEPVAHLDDLNRVALLDVFRAVVLEKDAQSNFVLTTANKALVRHMEEKFAMTSFAKGSPKQKLLRVISLDGNPRSGVSVQYGFGTERAGTPHHQLPS